ncbi:DNA-3-methyladenine glycosylase [Gemmatimonas aurantiaca T-27]|uniref:DNA-3-methyladenine glycosylase II n=1 Tax=Gemmatimonas aurantiaca (strain DSM 14586 / JCM 11422 / NBRC 100505 / T-27) TaxID=379066 RepID=C1ABY5_GEMAT|nr:DNA-3-methyladenine glycosylase [Gemmatimonas aurantiaca]BAH40012.1 DNA-3-methyladenine glycosylase [Gemmatimonas aurantiaca T-27]
MPSSTESPAPAQRLTRASLAAAVQALSAQDPSLAAIVARHGTPPLWARPAGFATLGRIVLEQQVSLEAAATLWRRLDAQIPGGFHAAPVAEIGVDALRALGLTRQKSAYLHGLATAVADRTLDLALLARASDAEVMSRLTALHGIGPWTASVYLLFALRRPDVWPPGDLALHLAMRDAHGWPKPPASPDATRHAERWAPWRAAAARILWHGYLRERGRG